MALGTPKQRSCARTNDDGRVVVRGRGRTPSSFWPASAHAPLRNIAGNEPWRSQPQPTTALVAPGSDQQSRATSNAAQICAIRSGPSTLIRSTSTPTETLSTESRFTAQRRGTPSDAGSSSTSLGSPRMVVVHGAIRVRRRRGIAASRERTTTGRRPISGSSDHHTSPRRGSDVTYRPPLHETRRDHPIHPPRSEEPSRRRRTQRRSPPVDEPGGMLSAPRRGALRPSNPGEACGLRRGVRRSRWC